MSPPSAVDLRPQIVNVFLVQRSCILSGWHIGHLTAAGEALTAPGLTRRTDANAGGRSSLRFLPPLCSRAPFRAARNALYSREPRTHEPIPIWGRVKKRPIFVALVKGRTRHSIEGDFENRLQYSRPEPAEPNHRGVDTRSDVCSLPSPQSLNNATSI